MTAESTNAELQGRNRTAAGYMLAAVVSLSLIPLLIVWGKGTESPFLFNALWRLGLGFGYLLLLLVVYRSLLLNKQIITKIRHHIFRWSMLFLIINNFQLATFSLSARFVDISITAILFETWPVFLILLMGWLFVKEKRYWGNTFPMIPFLLLAFVGVVFVTLSQTRGFDGISKIVLSTAFIGIILALTAAVMSGFAAFGFKWGTDLAEGISAASITTKHDLDSLSLFSVVVANLVSNFVSIPLNAAFSVMSAETVVIDWTMIASALVGGMLIHTLGDIGWRKSNLITSNLGVNALGYLIPIGSLTFLWIFSYIGVARVGFLIIGTAAIITANLLINFEAEVRLGFKSLIVALWVCGVFVYLRPVESGLLVVDDWIWAGASYFEALTLSATVFTLILSFRVARLVSRTTDEEHRTFTLFQKLDLLASRNVIDSDVRQHILTIDVSEQNPQHLKAAYGKVMNSISKASASDASYEDKQMLSEAAAELNSLVYSKQHGLVIGKLFALYIFAGISVFIALFARPDVSGWTAFLIELFAMLFSSVVIFLISNVHDLQSARIAGILTRTDRGNYEIVFRNIQARAFEQWFSVTIILVLGIGYAWLLWDKWIQ